MDCLSEAGNDMNLQDGTSGRQIQQLIDGFVDDTSLLFVSSKKLGVYQNDINTSQQLFVEYIKLWNELLETLVGKFVYYTC